MTSPLAHPSRGHLSLRGAAVLLLLACAACSGEVVAGDAESPRARTTPLSLKPHGPPLPTRKLVRRLEVPEGLKPWVALEGKAKVVPLGTEEGAGERRGVQLLGEGRKTLAIPGDFPAHAFNRVVVELVAPQGVSGALALREEGAWRGDWGATLEGGSSELRELRFEPRTRRLAPGRCRGLRLELTSPGACFVRAISFWKVPLTELVPGDPGRAMALEVGGDRRERAYLLPSGRELRAHVEVPEDAVLRLGYALIPGLADEDGRVGVEVRVESGAGTRTFSNLGFREPGAERRWNPVTIPLAEHAGRLARIRIELAPSATGEQLAAICEPKLLLLERTPPTVLLITSDSHRADHVGAYVRNRLVRTPALDRLADRGVVFTDCFASGGDALLSYVALQTGSAPRATSGGATSVPRDETTLAELFAARGWTTVAALSSPELDPDATGLGRGFERLLLPGRQPSPARRAARWMREQVRSLDGEALFAWLHLSDPELPYDPPEVQRRFVFGNDALADLAELPEPRYPITPLPADAAGQRAAWYLRALYRAEVGNVDQELGPLLGSPRVLGGIVAFTSDHGVSLGEHGVWFSPAGLYPPTLRVPLILVWPDAPQLRVRRGVGTVDLGRTLLDLAGLESVPFPGSDLLAEPVEEGGAGGTRYSLGLDGRSAAITADGWHLVLNLAPEERPECEERKEPHSLELYDLAADPACGSDTCAREFDRARALRELLLAWLPEGVLAPNCACGWCAGVRPEVPVGEETEADETGTADPEPAGESEGDAGH